MQREALIGIGVCDIALQLRGKMVPAPHRPARIANGTGWSQVCAMPTCFGEAADPEFAKGEDVMLMPAPATEVEFGAADGAAKTWLGQEFHGTYLAHKRAELREIAGLDEAAMCARYAGVY